MPSYRLRSCLKIFFAEVEKLCEAQGISTEVVDDEET